MKIPLDTPHPRMAALAEHGWAQLTDADFEVPAIEWESLEYMDWKSGGDTNFAPLATADGELDCRGFWDKGKTDKDAMWTSNAEIAPTLRAYVDGIGANFGRVRVIKLEPQSHEEAFRSFHRDDNNRFNPDDEGWVVRTWLELTVGRRERGEVGVTTALPVHVLQRFPLDGGHLEVGVCELCPTVLGQRSQPGMGRVQGDLHRPVLLVRPERSHASSL